MSLECSGAFKKFNRKIGDVVRERSFSLEIDLYSGLSKSCSPHSCSPISETFTPISTSLPTSPRRREETPPLIPNKISRLIRNEELFDCDNEELEIVDEILIIDNLYLLIKEFIRISNLRDFQVIYKNPIDCLLITKNNHLYSAIINKDQKVYIKSISGEYFELDVDKNLDCEFLIKLNKIIKNPSS